jgi:superfamily II DNA or RNA helicase
MLQRVQAGRGRYEEICRSGDWTFLSPLLGDEQKKAVLKVLHSRDMVISVRGPAGSGKTLMMQEAVKAVAALSGRDVLVVAPSTLTNAWRLLRVSTWPPLGMEQRP